MNHSERLRAMEERMDFLIDAWIRGMADQKELDRLAAEIKKVRDEFVP